MMSDLNFLKLRSFDSLFISHMSNLLAYRLRFESLAASDRFSALGKITTATEHCQDIKLGPNARAP